MKLVKFTLVMIIIYGCGSVDLAKKFSKNDLPEIYKRVTIIEILDDIQRVKIKFNTQIMILYSHSILKCIIKKNFEK